MKIYEYIIKRDEKAYVLEIPERERQLIRIAVTEKSVDPNLREEVQEEFRKISESLEYSNILYGPVKKTNDLT